MSLYVCISCLGLNRPEEGEHQQQQHEQWQPGQFRSVATFGSSMAALADGWVSCGGKRKPWNYGTVEALARDKCCECAPLAADAGEDSEDDLDEVLNRIMVPAESSAPTFEDTLAASENLFEKTCEILGIPKTETQILAEDDTGMLIPRSSGPAMPRPYVREDCRARHRCRGHPLAERTAQRLLGDLRRRDRKWLPRMIGALARVSYG